MHPPAPLSRPEARAEAALGDLAMFEAEAAAASPMFDANKRAMNRRARSGPAVASAQS